jgi:hypothetical protein
VLDFSRIFRGALILLSLIPSDGQAATTPIGVPSPSLLQSAYQNDESFHFVVSWSGGIKIGDLQLNIRQVAGGQDQFEIHARVSDYGAFHFFYPVDDSFITTVQGPQRLPIRYEVHQKEGRSYQAHRLTLYNQEKGRVRYRKNEGPEKEFVVEGPVHNEFSSFFATRVLSFAPDSPVIVPTFADEKRHEVVVTPQAWTQLEESLLGTVAVIEVLPRMTFKGLYDKSGDTVIWFSDDACRVPVRISSKILIGSLVADLVAYQGKSCGREWNLDQEIIDKEAATANRIHGD